MIKPTQPEQQFPIKAESSLVGKFLHDDIITNSALPMLRFECDPRSIAELLHLVNLSTHDSFLSAYDSLSTSSLFVA